MKTLDEILIGFLIFFAIERTTRLFSNGVVEPWAERKNYSRNSVENWKLSAELLVLVTAIFVAWRFRKDLAKLS